MADQEPEEPVIEKKGRGAQPGSSNRLRTGVRTHRHGMVMTRLSALYPNVYRQVHQFRMSLEKAVKAIYGEKMSYEHAAEINMASRYELTGRVAEHLIAKGESKDVMRDLEIVVKMVEKRHRCIRRLKLEKPGQEGKGTWGDYDADAVGAVPPAVVGPAPIEMPKPEPRKLPEAE